LCVFVCSWIALAAGGCGADDGVVDTEVQAVVTPGFRQKNQAVPQTPQVTVAVPYTAAQGAGNLNVVVVGWNDTVAQVSSVTDAKGNAYQLAAGPTQRAGVLTQSIYYARNIAAAAAGANTVTVVFNQAATYADVRILEYSGIDPVSPFDVSASASGSSASASSGNATTTNASDLLVGANMVLTFTSAPGAGYTQRVVTSPDGDIAEDRVVTAIGSYSATATLGPAGGWVMQMVAFKAAGSTPPPPDTQPPTAPTNLVATASSGSQINLTWTASTDNVGVTGYLVERCDGAGCSSFAQIGTATATSFASTGLSPATSYSYRVRATDAAANLSGYSNTATATTLAPDTQPPTAPTNLMATAVSGSQINLAWTASTDNVGVTGYLIERCQGAGCSSFAQVGTSVGASFADGGLAASTTYRYRVRATDAASNLGGYSNIAGATTQTTPTAPGFVQARSASPQSPQTVVSLSFASAQSAGDLNVAVVGWNDSNAQVSSIADSAGNTYTLAIGPTVQSGIASQSIYYAKNIPAAAANTVTVTFTAAATFPDIRIVEYRGLHPTTPLDVAVAGTGTATLTNSGTATTTNAVDLLVGANLVQTTTTGAGSGFTSRSLTVPDGDIVEDRTTAVIGSYGATAPLSSGGPWIMQMVAFRAADSPPPPPADSTPPTVSVTSPSGGATLSGTVTASVSASDNVGVASVQLLVDGVVVKVPDTTSPYSFSLNTALFANGSHSLAAYAWDAARNRGTATPIAVTFSNASPGNPAQTGLWSGITALPLVAVNVALLSTGKILMWDAQSFGVNSSVWDPDVNSFFPVGAPANLFCSSVEQMADGRIFVAGGHVGAHVGLTVANLFDPTTQSWVVLPDMTFPRWYPTTTTLPDGRLIQLSGETSCAECFVTIPEIYNPANGAWSQLTSAQFSFSYYPHVFVLPDGRLLVSSTAEDPTASRVLDLSALTWTAIGGPAVDGGSALMYAPGKILKSGTSVDPDTAARPSTATAYVLDTTQASPTWRTVAPMGRARTYHYLTALPDGNVLLTGGGPTTAATDTANAVLATEIWSPASETWTTVAAMNAPRLYHSVAMLLPDGRVVVAGGGRFDDLTAPTDQFNAEFFSPPYLFKGPRPVIGSAPATLTYGSSFTIQTPDAARIARVSLIRFGAVTHSINMAQHFVPAAFTAGSSSLTVTAPANPSLAPPGYYMLFLVDTLGVPSVAATVRL